MSRRRGRVSCGADNSEPTPCAWPGERGTSRRNLLRGAAASIAGAGLPGFAQLALAPAALAQVGTGGSITVAPLGDDLTLLTGAGGNMLARTTSEGLALVDSGAAADRSALLGWLAFGDRPGWQLWAGAAVIVASGGYIFHRERRQARTAAA